MPVCDLLKVVSGIFTEPWPLRVMKSQGLTREGQSARKLFTWTGLAYLGLELLWHNGHVGYQELSHTWPWRKRQQDFLILTPEWVRLQIHYLSSVAPWLNKKGRSVIESGRCHYSTNRTSCQFLARVSSLLENLLNYCVIILIIHGIKGYTIRVSKGCFESFHEKQHMNKKPFLYIPSIDFN